MRYLALTGLMAAMIAIMTAYICHIPIGVNGGYIHFGDSLIYLAASILPAPYALAAAAIGGGLADLMTAPVWMTATIIIKLLIALPFTSKNAKIINSRNIAAAVMACFVCVLGYFAAECVIFGSFGTAALASIYGNLIQSAGSAVFFVLFGIALDKAHIKRRIGG